MIISGARYSGVPQATHKYEHQDIIPPKRISSAIPDFLKYAIPMEKIIPSSISNRRMDIILPGYSRTRYVK